MNNKRTDMKTILDLCSGTGAWSQPYVDAGYNVIRVDLQLGYDVKLWPSNFSDFARLPNEFVSVVELNIHGILAAPVCTVFSGSGARWARTDEAIHQGLSLVDACLRIVYATNPKWWCLENPVGKLQKWIGPPVKNFQPNEYGDPYTKRTCLWGTFQMPQKPSF